MTNKLESYIPKNKQVVCDYKTTNARLRVKYWVFDQTQNQTLSKHSEKKIFETLKKSLVVAETFIRQGKVELLHASTPLYMIIMSMLEEMVGDYQRLNQEDSEVREEWIEAKRQFASYTTQCQKNINHPFFKSLEKLEKKLQKLPGNAEDKKFLFKTAIPAFFENPLCTNIELFELFEPSRQQQPQFLKIKLPFSCLFQSGRAVLIQLQQNRGWVFGHILKKLDELKQLEPDWESTMQYFLESKDSDPSLSAEKTKEWFLQFEKEFESSVVPLITAENRFEEEAVRGFLKFVRSHAIDTKCLQNYFPDISETLETAATVLTLSSDIEVATRSSGKRLLIEEKDKQPLYEALAIRQELYTLIDTYILAHLINAHKAFQVLTEKKTAFQKLFPSKEEQVTYLGEVIRFPVQKSYSEEFLKIEPKKKKKPKNPPQIEKKQEAVLPNLIEKKETVPEFKKIEIEKIVLPAKQSKYQKVIEYGRRQLVNFKDSQKIALGQALWHLENLMELSKIKTEKKDWLNVATLLTAHAAWALEQLYDMRNTEERKSCTHLSHNLKVLHERVFGNDEFPEAVNLFYQGNHWARFFFDQGQKWSEKEAPPVLALLIQLAENPDSLSKEAFEGFMKKSIESVFQTAAELMKVSSLPTIKEESVRIQPPFLDSDLFDWLESLIKELEVQIENSGLKQQHRTILMLRQAKCNLQMLESSLAKLTQVPSCGEASLWLQRSLFLIQESLERTLQALYFLKHNEVFKHTHEINIMSFVTGVDLGELGMLFLHANQKVRYPLVAKDKSSLDELYDKSQTLRHFPELNEGYNIIAPEDGFWLITKNTGTIDQLTNSLRSILEKTLSAFEKKLLPAFFSKKE